jgi:glutamate dehydrogenase/leucine dehydrogenase
VIRSDYVTRLKAWLVAQGANIPVTEKAEAALHERRILSIPDLLARAGGIICASVEYHGSTRESALQTPRAGCGWPCRSGAGV